MTQDYRFNDRLDFVMCLLAFSGVGVAVFVPAVLILLSTVYSIPYFDYLVIICQLGGCAMIGIGLSYFICRKEL